ncbi:MULTISPECIES: 2,3-diaminopropionate biosynthesis protein SbnB [Streptomyces]|uniref:2,3-diaminopropionate biosynthesis protein SbnB n=1 Tax=Streptomyces TaxID=1883 RepID=UPI0013B79D64|nr:2,3-diaminopropionate biosynthesis protein SbnB [Streptomyces sennicomposti]MBY8864132.1 2,3-diaminopropionate biosynthesis protein SbnB [Streptomyces sennicomposti]MYX45462.1 2,3-diaminopropionate biosynthesis protein SbnB [Streptomyces sp. SID89]NED77890.1 2,3-diaminopropionate biosynthesis protein SbnB [Streptomyces sp. SID9944]
MPSPTQTPSFAVIPGAEVDRALTGRHIEVTGIIEDAYRLHGAGGTVNPPSYFLRFPDRPDARIIALPASVGGDIAVDGIKWISSFPGNITSGLPRASAVLILNDPATGYPLACVESSIISASRTAASAALAARRLSEARGVRPRRVGYIGTGLIARYVHDFLAGTGWEFDEIGVHDLKAEYARQFAGTVGATAGDANVTVHDGAESLIRGSDLVVFATVAATPHIDHPGWFAHDPLVLHLSLRDLGTDVVLSAANFVDDVEHCLKAGTSPHLAEQRVGHRDFIEGTLHDVLTGAAGVPDDKPVIFSPFGLGVLDLALGKYVYDTVQETGRLDLVEGFFHETRRYG